MISQNVVLVAYICNASKKFITIKEFKELLMNFLIEKVSIVPYT